MTAAGVGSEREGAEAARDAHAADRSTGGTPGHDANRGEERKHNNSNNNGNGGVTEREKQRNPPW